MINLASKSILCLVTGRDPPLAVAHPIHIWPNLFVPVLSCGYIALRVRNNRRRAGTQRAESLGRLTRIVKMLPSSGVRRRFSW